MTGKTHQLIGITSGLAWFLSQTPAVYNPATLLAVLVSSHLAALLPDADTPAGKIWDSIPLGHTLGKITDPFIKHRNISHSLFGIILVGYASFKLFSIFPAYWGINAELTWQSTMIAYISHLLADSFTVEGIPLFYPYKRMFGIPPKPFEGIRIVTGKWFENLIIFPIISIILIIIILMNKDLLHIILYK